MRPLDALADIRPSGPIATALELRRAWPRSADHLLLEYTTTTGTVVGGQWFRSRRMLEPVAVATRRVQPAAPPVVIECGGETTLLHVGGCDRRLRALVDLLSRPDAELLSHRPERRAVVRLAHDGAPAFVKVVRRSRLDRVVGPLEHLRSLAGRPFDIPRVLDVDPNRGMVIFAALDGATLPELLSAGGAPQATSAVGEALRWLHDAPPPATAATHGVAEESALLQEQIERLEAFDAAFASEVRQRLRAVVSGLRGGSSPPALLHRDFYDKQVFVDSDLKPALIDLDTLGVGEAALDVANMLGHLELRALQGRCDSETATEAAGAFLGGYDASAAVTDRVGAWLDATRLRLACLYAFRPSRASLPAQLLALVGTPPLATAPADARLLSHDSPDSRLKTQDFPRRDSCTTAPEVR